ncbi:hypothetical protein D3C80_1950890 [compost metagenome]
MADHGVITSFGQLELHYSTAACGQKHGLHPMQYIIRIAIEVDRIHQCPNHMEGGYFVWTGIQNI